MRFLILQDRIQQFLGSVVARLGRQADGFIVGLDRAGLAVVIVLDLLGHILADGDLRQVADHRPAFQEEDPPDKLLGVLHLVNRALFHRCVEFGISPIRVHLGMDHVLADRGQFLREPQIQLFNDFNVAFHFASFERPAGTGGLFNFFIGFVQSRPRPRELAGGAGRPRLRISGPARLAGSGARELPRPALRKLARTGPSQLPGAKPPQLAGPAETLLLGGDFLLDLRDHPDPLDHLAVEEDRRRARDQLREIHRDQRGVEQRGELAVALEHLRGKIELAGALKDPEHLEPVQAGPDAVGDQARESGAGDGDAPEVGGFFAQHGDDARFNHPPGVELRHNLLRAVQPDERGVLDFDVRIGRVAEQTDQPRGRHRYHSVHAVVLRDHRGWNEVAGHPGFHCLSLFPAHAAALKPT